MTLLRSAEMTVRDLLGRRWVLVLLVLVPLIFYAARRSDGSWQGIRMACMGLAWALSTVSLFSTQSALGLEPRLRMAGLPSSALFFGRTFALMACAVAGGGLYAVLISVDQDAVHGWAVAAALMVSAGLSVPLGMLVGTLPRPWPRCCRCGRPDRCWNTASKDRGICRTHGCTHSGTAQSCSSPGGPSLGSGYAVGGISQSSNQQVEQAPTGHPVGLDAQTSAGSRSAPDCISNLRGHTDITCVPVQWSRIASSRAMAKSSSLAPDRRNALS